MAQKLYTEEQVIKAYKDGNRDGFNHVCITDTYLDFVTPIELPSDEELAILFHNKYEELAPEFKYETRMQTKKFTKDSNNGKLMIAVCKEILQYLTKTNNYGTTNSTDGTIAMGESLPNYRPLHTRDA